VTQGRQFHDVGFSRAQQERLLKPRHQPRPSRAVPPHVRPLPPARGQRFAPHGC